MIAHRVEGIAIAPVSDRSKSHLRRLAKFGVPFVLVDRTVPGIDVRRHPRRQRRRRAAARGAPDLARPPPDRLHRRVGRGLDCSRPPAGLRVRAAARPAIALDPALVADGDGRPEWAATRACSGCSQLDDPPTAVFTVNNLVALGAIEAVRAGRARGPRRRGARLLRRHRVRLAPLSLPHRHGATGGGVRDARHTATARSHRGPRATSAGAWSFFRPSSSSASRAARRSGRGDA